MFEFNPNPRSIQSISFSFNKTSDNSRLEKTTFPVRKLIIKTYVEWTSDSFCEVRLCTSGISNVD